MDNFFKFQVYKVGVIHTDTDDISYQEIKWYVYLISIYGYMRSPVVEVSTIMNNEGGYVKKENIVLWILFLQTCLVFQKAILHLLVSVSENEFNFATAFTSCIFLTSGSCNLEPSALAKLPQRIDYRLPPSLMLIFQDPQERNPWNARGSFIFLKNCIHLKDTEK